MKILHICCDPKPTEESVCKQMATEFFSAAVAANPEAEVINVDLYKDPPPYLSYEAYRAIWYPVYIAGYHPTDEEKAAAAYAADQAARLNDADVLVLTTPMWNFSVPAVLKAWFDMVISPGYAYEMENGETRPSHHIRSAVLLVSSGEAYKEDDPRDALTPLVRAVCSHIGIADISVAWADGQDPLLFKDCEPRKQVALEAAREIAEELSES